MKDTTVKFPVLALYVTTSCNDNIGHIRAEPVALMEDAYPRSGHALEDLKTGLWLDGLVLEAFQGGYPEPGESNEDNLITHDLGYADKYRVELPDAERMVRTLRTVERRLAKIREDLGPSQSYTQQVMRFAKVIGATRFVFRHPTEPGVFVNMRPDDAHFRIRSLIADWPARVREAVR